MLMGMPRLGSDLPLFARESELATLREALVQAASGRPAAVIVSGDAGVGKSRLLHEFTSTAGGDAFVVAGHCLDTADSALPYLPFAEAVGALSRLRPELVDRYRGLRTLLPGQAQDSEGELGRLGLFEDLHAALADLAAERPLALFIEDLHWADRSSRELLVFLISRLVGQRVLLVGTYRSDALHRSHPLRALLAELVRLPAVQRLHLDPFPPEVSLSFVRALNTGLDEETATKIAAASEGNAFLAEELAAAETHTVTFELAEVLLARTERLPDTAKQVVRLASAIGRVFTYERLNAAVWSLLDETGIKHERELDQALRAAISHGIVVQKSDDLYAFRHALLREALYSDLLPGERSRYHHRIAESLAGDRSPGAAAELAHHACESSDLATGLAASVQAADEAHDLAAPAEALLHLERALRIFDSVDESDRPAGATELELTMAAAAQAEACGEFKRALSYSSEAVALADRADDTVQAAACRRRYANHLMVIEGYEEEAHRVAREAWELVKDDRPHATKAWVQAVLARLNLRRPRLGAEWAHRAVATADAVEEMGPRPASGGDASGSKPGGHLAAKADALVTLAAAGIRQGGPLEESLRLADEALGMVEGTGWHEVEMRARFNTGVWFIENARIAEALERFDAGMSRAAQTGYKWSSYGTETAVRQVICNFLLGEWDAAEAAGEMASSVVPGLVMTRLAAAVLLVDVARGRFDVADRRLAYLSDRWQLDGQVLALAGLSGIELDRWRGRPGEAVATAERTVARISSIDDYHLAGVSVCAVGVGAAADLARTARRDGDDQAAAAAVEAGRRLAETCRSFLETGRPLSGTLGPEGRAWLVQLAAEEARLAGEIDPGRWYEVYEAFSYGEPYRRACAQWRAAEALLERGEGGHRAEAASRLAEAARTAAELGAKPLLAEVTALSERARLGAPGRDGTPLTPRELEVLRLVARGLTNRQIGARLYISEKTVSVHLSRAMSKLEVSNRAEAVNAAHLRGYLAAPPGPQLSS